MNPDDIERRVARLERELKSLDSYLAFVTWALLLMFLVFGLMHGCSKAHGGERLVEVTAYCNESPKGKPGAGCRICCGRWAPNNETASGVRPIEGTTVACNWLPFGTKVKVEGFKVGKVVQDRMASDEGFDIYFGSEPGAHKRARKWGRRKLRITW